MQLSGKVWKDGKFWLIECPSIQGMTQGHSKKEALEMMVDWVRSKLDQPEFPVEIEAVDKDEFVMTFSQPAPVLGLMVQQARLEAGLSLQEVAERAKVKHRSTVNQAEEGKSEVSVSRLSALLHAMGFEVELRVRKIAPTERRLKAKAPVQRRKAG